MLRYQERSIKFNILKTWLILDLGQWIIELLKQNPEMWENSKSYIPLQQIISNGATPIKRGIRHIWKPKKSGSLLFCFAASSQKQYVPSLYLSGPYLLSRILTNVQGVPKKCPIATFSLNLFQKSDYTFSHVFWNQNFEPIPSKHFKHTYSQYKVP